MTQLLTPTPTIRYVVWENRNRKPPSEHHQSCTMSSRCLRNIAVFPNERQRMCNSLNAPTTNNKSHYVLVTFARKHHFTQSQVCMYAAGKASAGESHCQYTGVQLGRKHLLAQMMWSRSCAYGMCGRWEMNIGERVNGGRLCWHMIGAEESRESIVLWNPITVNADATLWFGTEMHARRKGRGGVEIAFPANMHFNYVPAFHGACEIPSVGWVVLTYSRTFTHISWIRDRNCRST